MVDKTFYTLVYAWIGFGLLLFPLLLKIPAPYGRHSRPGWGVMVSGRLGWLLMELPALVVFAFFFLAGPLEQGAAASLFFGLWMLHYANRTLIFPFRLKSGEKRMPVVIVLMAFVFNCINGFFNGYYFGFLAPPYVLSWFLDSRFIIGVSLFFVGLAVNWRYDHILLGLKRLAGKQYLIPQGGLFRYVSCPNHLGEVVEWGGFALMVWSLPALSFFVWTVVNLLPRALDHHRWYKKQFEDYPPRRKALIPFLI